MGMAIVNPHRVLVEFSGQSRGGDGNINVFEGIRLQYVTGTNSARHGNSPSLSGAVKEVQNKKHEIEDGGVGFTVEECLEWSSVHMYLRIGVARVK